MPHIIIWNTFNSKDHSSPTNPVPKVAARTCGPHQLATWLSKFDFCVKVIDFCHLMSLDDLMTLTRANIDSHTIAIGVSTTFWQNYVQTSPYEEPQWVIDARKILEKEYSTLEWLLGGVAAYPGKLYRFRWKMYASYAEESLLKYLNEKTEQYHVDSFNIQTLDYHYQDNCSIKPYEVLPIQLGRGCQFKCKFCDAPLIGKKKGSYIRSIDHVEAELLSNYQRFGTTRYYFIDDTVNEDYDKILALADMAQRLPFRLEWVGYLRLDLIASHPNSILLLKQSGLRSAFFGIESFNSATAAAISKGWMAKKGKDFLLYLRDQWKEDINWTLSFVVGLPHETKESLNQTQHWLIDNQMGSWLWNPLWLDMNSLKSPKSEFEQNSAQYGYRAASSTSTNRWSSDLWDDASVKIVATELSREKYSYQKLATWPLAETATTLEMEFDDLINKPISNLNHLELEERVEQQVSNYIKDQINGCSL